MHALLTRCFPFSISFLPFFPQKVHRYTMTKEEIVTCAEFAYTQGMGTLMLQSGELPTPERIKLGAREEKMKERKKFAGLVADSGV